jgi:hypothetical protein
MLSTTLMRALKNYQISLLYSRRDTTAPYNYYCTVQKAECKLKNAKLKRKKKAIDLFKDK